MPIYNALFKGSKKVPWQYTRIWFRFPNLLNFGGFNLIYYASYSDSVVMINQNLLKVEETNEFPVVITSNKFWNTKSTKIT